MDLEQLSKAQIILLTLLVSFVTSIATGIVTVSLLEQAPPGVTRTINRVVERTVERIVPAEEGEQVAVVSGVAGGEREVTVVVTETELIPEAVDKNSKALVRIMRNDSRILSEPDAGAYIAQGVLVSRDGIVVTDGSGIDERALYAVSTSDGTLYGAKVVFESPDTGVAYLRINVLEGEAPAFSSVSLASSGRKLGEAVIALGGETGGMVTRGIISDLPSAEGAATGTPLRIDTDIPLSRVEKGSPLIELMGDVVGIYIGSKSLPSFASFVPSRLISVELGNIPLP